MKCNPCRSHLLPAALTACLAGFAAAQTDADSARGVTVTFGDLRGQIVAIDKGFVSVVFPGSPGSTARLATTAVSPDKLFDFRLANMQADDADAWLRLADYAGLHDLHVRRIEALQTAAQRDPQRKDMLDALAAKTRSVCAKEHLLLARELRAAGELHDAVAQLEAITSDFTDCAAGKQAQKLLTEIRKNLGEERTQASTQQNRRQLIQENYPGLIDAREVLAAGQKLLKQGLNNLDDLVESRDAFEDALSRFQRVRRQLDQWSEREREEPLAQTVTEERNRLAQLARHRAVNAHIQLGYVYIARGDQQSALKHLGNAAALDLGSLQVSRLRLAIASSYDR